VSAGGTLGSGGDRDSGSAGDGAPEPTADSGAPRILEPFAAVSHWNEASKYGALRAAGVRMIRIDVAWYHVEPTQGSFDWSRIDRAMAEARAQRIEVLAILGYTNDWASGGIGLPGVQHYAPPETYDDEWGNYIQETASRYHDDVAAWEIWNEPDHDNFFRMNGATWAENHYPGESAVQKKRLEYLHLLEIARAQPALADAVVTTSGFAEGGGFDAGLRGWLESQSGFLNRFDVASYHCYGYPSYQRLIDVSESYRATQSAIGKAGPWPFWITEHGINTPGVDASTVKTYLIRSFATALAQEGVEKMFWFRAGYDPSHMDLFDASDRTTPAYDALATLSGHWSEPTSIAAWESATSARGSIASLSGGDRVAIVWNDGPAVAIDAIGLDVETAFDQNDVAIPTSAALTSAPVFLTLSL
jgi:hypothetical protein